MDDLESPVRLTLGAPLVQRDRPSLASAHPGVKPAGHEGSRLHFLDLRDQWRGCRFLKSSAMVSKLAQVMPSWELM
jgi:hypothetical protein